MLAGHAYTKVKGSEHMWNVWVVADGTWRRVAVIEAAENEIHGLAGFLRGVGENFDIRLAAWENGTLKV
jgi:hypothetical protein